MIYDHLDTAGHVAKEGSPLLLQAVGRLCGLGADDRNALARHGVPAAVWGIVGIGAGLWLGVYLQRKHAGLIEWVPGGRP